MFETSTAISIACFHAFWLITDVFYCGHVVKSETCASIKESIQNFRGMASNQFYLLNGNETDWERAKGPFQRVVIDVGDILEKLEKIEQKLDALEAR